MLNELEILTSGQKLRKIRKRIGATQKDVTGDEVSRNLISQIENGKTNLSIATAKIIADNMNSIITKKGIKDLYITSEWLLADKETQTNNIADKYIKELRAIKLENRTYEYLKDKINEIEDFIYQSSVNFKKQSELYEIISDIYFGCKEDCEAFLKLQLSIDTALKDEQYNDAARLMVQLAKHLYMLGGSSFEQLRNMHIALNLYKENNLKDEGLLKKIYFNTALYYSIADKNKAAIDYLNKLKEECNLAISECLDVDLLIANCYEGDKKYDLAEELYLATLDIALKESEAEIIIKIYSNLGTIYRIKGDREKSLKYLNHAINIKSYLEPINYAKSLYTTIENFIKMDCEELIIKNYNKALEFIDRCNDNRMYYELIVMIYDYFMSIGNRDIVYSILKKTQVGIKRKIIIEKDVVNLFFKASHELKDNELFERGIKLLKLF